MKKRTGWTDAEKQELRALRVAGYPLVEIATRLSRGRWGVRDMARELEREARGLPPPDNDQVCYDWRHDERAIRASSARFVAAAVGRARAPTDLS